MTEIAAIANALGKAKKTPEGYMCLCPCHEDGSPSLSLTLSDSGDLICNCFAGCDWKAIKLELTNRGILVPIDERKEKARIVATYDYRNAAGDLIFQKVRLEPKSFFIQHPNGNGKMAKGMGPSKERPLFNLPAVLEAIRKGEPVAICEGEKDAIRFTEKSGIPATTCFEGAPNWRNEYGDYFYGASVYVLWDNDGPGEERRDRVIASLKGKASSIKKLSIPCWFKDFSDWADHSDKDWQTLWAEDVKEEKTSGSIGTDFSPIQPPPVKSLYIATDALDFIKKDIPIRRHIQGPFVVGSLNLVSAPTGVGKTWFSMGLAYSIALGTSFLQWENELRQKVLYIDGELPSHLIKERLLLFSRFNGNKLPDPGYFKLITPDEQNAEMPDIGMPEGRAALEPIIKESDFIVFDNLSTLMRSGGKENESESFQKIQTWLIHVIRKNQKSALLVHHTGKDPERGPRGSVSKEDALDTSLMLKRPEGANPDDGVNFEITFRKKRFYRKNTSDGNPIRVTFNEDFGWGYEPLEDARLTAIKELLANGVPKKDIAAEIGVSKATAYRLMDQLNKAETDSETTSETRKKPKNYLEKEQDEYF